MASWNMFNIGLGYGLIQAWHEVITWTNADLVSIEPSTKYCKI